MMKSQRRHRGAAAVPVRRQSRADEARMIGERIGRRMGGRPRAGGHPAPAPGGDDGWRSGVTAPAPFRQPARLRASEFCKPPLAVAALMRPVVVRRVAPALAAVMLLASFSPAQAQWTSEADPCAGSDLAPDQRIEVCTKALAESGLAPSARAHALNNRGFAFNAKGDVERAMADYNEAIKLDPRLADAFNNRGAAEGAKGDLDAALADFDAAICINPALGKALLNRGLAHQVRGDFDAAIADFDGAIKIDAAAALAYRGRAAAREVKGDLTGAIEDLDQAIRLAPSSSEQFASRGRLYSRRGDFTRAIADDDEAIRLDPNASGALNNRCNIWMVKELYKNALADCSEALRIDPKLPAAHFNKGVLLGIAGDAAAAADEFSKTIDGDPRFGPAYKSRGNLRFDSGQFDLARADLDQAAQLLPNDPYVALWRYLAGRRAAPDDAKAATDLQHAAEHFDAAAWPAPVIALMLGKSEPGAVLQAVERGDARQAADRQCEASFYLGEWRLMQGEKGPALRQLEDAARNCRATFAEAAGARAELERLGR
jgi:lipoprotein NlpI